MPELPLLRQDKHGRFKPAFSYANNKVLIKQNCPTQEAHRFLGLSSKSDTLTRHYRNHIKRGKQDPYYYYYGEGKWLFYRLGKGKTKQGRKTYLWNVYFASQK